MARVAFATCREYADLDPDDRLLIEPLAARGITVEPAVWNDPSVDWDRFDVVVLRSTWDYPDAYPEFLAWGASVPRLINPIQVVRWNTDKRYLADLAAAGIPIVPTMFVEPGEAVTLPDDAPEVVVKPTTSIGSRDTARYARTDLRLAAHVARLHAGNRIAMLQPYVEEVEASDETGLIYALGAFSHAFRKRPLLRPDGSMPTGLFAEEDIAEREPSAAERAVGDEVIRFLHGRFGELVYARVDLLPGPSVIEVELTEPSLYLGYGAGAAERFADAIATASCGQ